MDHNTQASDARVLEELKRVIVNINRNLYEWKEAKSHKVFTISYSEIYGLTKNWFVRGLKTIFGAADIDRLLRRGNLVISVNDSELRLRAVYLSDSSIGHYSQKLYDQISRCLNKLDFSSLAYRPEKYGRTGQPITEGYDPYIGISFEDIEKHKFELPKN